MDETVNCFVLFRRVGDEVYCPFAKGRENRREFEIIDASFKGGHESPTQIPCIL